MGDIRDHFFSFFKILFTLERGERKEKERERNIPVRLPLARPLLGTWPATQACALMGVGPKTLWFAGLCSVQGTMPDRVTFLVAKTRLALRCGAVGGGC